MAKAGRGYEVDARDFFQSLGLNAELDQTIEGVRGKHDIDVWVTGNLLGFSIRWVVECKDWTKNVPKEKVLALQSIVADVGADKGFLLSEVGFQPGATAVARMSNVVLTSIAELAVDNLTPITEAVVGKLHIRYREIDKDLRMISKVTGGFTSDIWKHRYSISTIPDALDAAAKNQYPAIYMVDYDDNPHDAKDIHELVAAANKLLSDAEAALKEFRANIK